MHNAILTLNAGSSSLKFAVFQADSGLTLLVRGQVDAIHRRPSLSANDLRPNATPHPPRPLGDHPISHDRAAAAVIDWCKTALASSHRLAAVGHRVVHGGPNLDGPRVINQSVLADLHAIVPLAPLHQPQSLAVIQAATEALPAIAQVACFDTAFHRTMPPLAQAIAIPRRFTDQGVVRYGFHGLSYEFIASRLAQVEPRAAAGRTVVAHLGNGASLCAMRAGKSVATSMGLSALDGLVMGTRPGSLDPGVIFYLNQKHAMGLEEIQRTLYTESGLLGVSGVSSDVRELLASSNEHARFALSLFAYRAARDIASHAAAMQGLDALVFTGGIGEHAAPVRRAICLGCQWLGVEIDEAANAQDAMRISLPGSRVSAHVIPTDEEAVIARHTARLTAS